MHDQPILTLICSEIPVSQQYKFSGINLVTMNETLMKIPAEREQDFVWCVKQKNKKAYLKFDVGKNVE